MYIKDPSAVYLAVSSEKFSINVPGGRLLTQLAKEGALAAINAGAFNDDGSSGTHVGALPIGMVISEGRMLWDDGRSYNGFVGMTRDNRLYVSDSINRERVEELNIRDGCCFGPVLIKDGVPNEKVHAYSVSDNINSRTAIGQRADGSVIFLCIDGRQCGSIGATFDELLKIMVELECVNACALDGGASTIMAYRDTYGRYGTAGEVVTCSSYSLFQAAPRRMPTFFMVRPAEED
jgi:exopolysaccharide biosynthesis protein